ncbi:MAG: tRNA (adenosine(37)-N6)-threonylcarbamoyltransferase complex dimerization subunit type 1 TsaB [Gemmatimonadales bacterium]|nr:tRNA (adenosine(37)-N6)-threonylcarbamoyltransferase complex dimerization subunit type 1 TsaB [Gemmatimonadales bacterium]
MITLALDTATDRCSVAATDGTRVVERHLDGARQHARAVLGLADELLAELGATPRDVQRMLTADGPGSFTGLRVAASVAKGLAWAGRIEWRVAPSLLVRAAGHAPAAGGTVLALSDALRGDLYAGAWNFGAGEVVPVGDPPRARAPLTLADFGPVDVVVGSVPEPLRAAVEQATGRTLMIGPDALPSAAQLLRLDTLAGGTRAVDDVAGWEPEYGRPAEAQAVWERKHGRPLPSPPGIAR